MRLAASTYLNSAPLVHSFAHGKQRDRVTFLGDAAPSRCASMLASGECDIALIPVIEYQRIPNLRIIPDVAVASRHRVASVLLACRSTPESVRRVSLDSSSRTSQVLVRILFSRRYHNSPEFDERTPEPGCANMFENSDAALIIGDPTFQLRAEARASGLLIYDLAEEWRSLTGLPFVFAVWAIREDAFEAYLKSGLDFEAAKAEGVALITEIAARCAEELRTPVPELIRYLNENVNFELDTENLEGLREYFRLARECGLITENREIDFA